MQTPRDEASKDAPCEGIRQDLRRTRRDLRTCEQHSRLVHNALRALADAVVTVDLEGSITFMNPIAAHLTGWTEAESLGRPLHDVVVFTDSHGGQLDLLSPTGANGGINALRRRDGHSVLVDGALAPILDDDRVSIGSVITFRNVTAAKRLTDELTWHANHDNLTGLANRRSFEARLRRALATATEHGSRHSLLCFDLDRFKSVNDRAGHFAGDELLRQLAALLRKNLRDEDMLARLGGDEFALLLEDCSPSHAAHVAEKIRAEIAGFHFRWQGQAFRIGASIGQVDFSTGASFTELLVRADRMCYVAKSRGRNQVVAYDPSEDDAHRIAPRGGRTVVRNVRPGHPRQRPS